MSDYDTINIPAFQRKQSLAAKARKKSTLEKAVSKESRKAISSTRKKTTTRTPIIRPRVRDDEMFINIPRMSEPEPEEVFPNPFIDSVKEPSDNFREMKICGECEGYYDNINVAIVNLTSAVRVGDILIFEKNGGLFQQVIDSIQIDRKDVSLARTGSDIGLKVVMKPTVGTLVYKVI